MVILNALSTAKTVEKKRQNMIKLALNHGYTHPLTVQASQELDQILQTYHKK